MKLIFVRHGKTELNEQGLTQGWSDSPLTTIGKSQVMKTQKLLNEFPIDEVYCSPSQRAVQTALILLKERHLPVRIDSRLKEINFGSFEKVDERIRLSYHLESKQWTKDLNMDYRAYEGECLKEVIKREMAWLKEVIARHFEHSTILVCGHGCSFMGLLRTICAKDLDEKFPNFHFMANAGAVIVEYDGDFHIQAVIDPK